MRKLHNTAQHIRADVADASPHCRYAVLDLHPGVPESDIKITYRKKSLLIHPDKTKNPRAPDAFDRLKKAQTELMDEKKRAILDEAIADARMLLIRENKWTVDSPELKTDGPCRRQKLMTPKATGADTTRPLPACCVRS